MFVIFVLLVVVSISSSVLAVDYKVVCTAKTMTAIVTMPNSNSKAYLEKLNGYSKCAPKLEDGRAIFELSLEEIYTCGVVRVTEKITGRRIFYHYVVVEYGKAKKETMLIKCDIPNDKSLALRSKRNVLPANFTEATEFDTYEKIVENAPTPLLHVMVRQNDLPVDTHVNVQPGSPLQMVVYLDKNSSDTYGLLVKDMKVTDNTPNQEEIIMQDGCSMDPYLFNNFETTDGDTLSAKFRAFKFPESSFVLFIGTVNVCLNFCQGKSCSNGQIGYGRRRRELPPYAGFKDPNHIFEVTMTTIMRVGFGDLEDRPIGKVPVPVPEVQQDIIAASVYSGPETINVQSDRAAITHNQASNAIGTPSLIVLFLTAIVHTILAVQQRLR